MIGISRQLLNALVWLSADSKRINALLKLIDGLRVSGALEMRKSPQGLSLHVEPLQQLIELKSSGWAPYLVQSFTEETEDARWNYILIAQRTGSTTSWDGLENLGSTEYEGRNTYESSRLTRAGYQNSSVTGLYPIKEGTIVWGRPGIVNNVRKIIFSVPNEPKCA